MEPVKVHAVRELASGGVLLRAGDVGDLNRIVESEAFRRASLTEVHTKVLVYDIDSSLTDVVKQLMAKNGKRGAAVGELLI